MEIKQDFEYKFRWFNEYDKIVCFDTETTGVDFENSQIIEIAYSLYKREGKFFKHEKNVDLFVKIKDGRRPEDIILKENSDGTLLTVTGLTHITSEDLKDALSEKEMIDEIFEDIYGPNTLILGYNVNFDLNMLNSAVKRHYPEFVFENKYAVIDVLTLYKDNFRYDKELDSDGRAYGHRLDAAVKNLNVRIQNTHRAIDDALATYEVFQELQKKGVKVILYTNSFGFNDKFEIAKLPGINYYPQGFIGKSEVYWAICKKLKSQNK